METLLLRTRSGLRPFALTMVGCGNAYAPDVSLSWAEGTVRLSDVARGGAKLAGGGMSLRLAPANLAQSSRLAGGLFTLELLPLPPPTPPPSAFFALILEHHSRIVKPS